MIVRSDPILLACRKKCQETCDQMIYQVIITKLALMDFTTLIKFAKPFLFFWLCIDCYFISSHHLCSRVSSTAVNNLSMRLHSEHLRSKNWCSLPAPMWRRFLDLEEWPYLKAFSVTGWHSFLLETSPVAHVVTEIYTRSFAIRSCCHIGSLIIGLCHLIQTRVCPQVSQSYIFISYTVKYSWVISLKLSLRRISMLYPHQPNTFAWFCSIHPCGPLETIFSHGKLRIAKFFLGDEVLVFIDDWLLYTRKTRD